MLIGGLQKFTLVDYPGQVAATVFFRGCDFRCPFCHNPELVLPRQMDGQALSPEGVLSFLGERRGQLDGVVLTGGEPTLQNDLPDFIREIKKLGFAVKLDTNGGHPEMLERLLAEKLLDYIAMDIKAPIGINNQESRIKNYSDCHCEERSDAAISTSRQPSLSGEAKLTDYDAIAGVSVDLEKIKKSVGLIMWSGIPHEFRTTVVGGLHAPEDILAIARDIAGAERYFLQPYVFAGKIIGDPAAMRPFPSAELRRLAEECRRFVKACEVRE